MHGATIRFTLTLYLYFYPSVCDFFRPYYDATIKTHKEAEKTTSCYPKICSEVSQLHRVFHNALRDYKHL